MFVAPLFRSHYQQLRCVIDIAYFVLIGITSAVQLQRSWVIVGTNLGLLLTLSTITKLEY